MYRAVPLIKSLNAGTIGLKYGLISSVLKAEETTEEFDGGNSMALLEEIAQGDPCRNFSPSECFNLNGATLEQKGALERRGPARGIVDVANCLL